MLVELEPVGGAHQANLRLDIWVKFRETLDDAREYPWAQRARLSSRPAVPRTSASTRSIPMRWRP